MKETKGSEFIKYFRPILEVLRELGGSGTASEIVDRSLEVARVTEAEQEEVNKNGQSRVKNQVHWARQYLVWSDYLDSSKRGVWSLTEKGTTANLTTFNARDLFNAVRTDRFSRKRDKKQPEPPSDEPAPHDAEIKDHRSALLDIIKSLSPSGFERLSQRLLRESGFQHVTVTGKSNDGGIDGNGTLQVNPFVSFTVLFQCKRYQGVVTPSQVPDFRGAMMGRADKGLIVTTGTFTLEAKKEARRDGVPPIELVDGEILVDMFENLEFGLIPKREFDVDAKFFDEYKK